MQYSSVRNWPCMIAVICPSYHPLTKRRHGKSTTNSPKTNNEINPRIRKRRTENNDENEEYISSTDSNSAEDDSDFYVDDEIPTKQQSHMNTHHYHRRSHHRRVIFDNHSRSRSRNKNERQSSNISSTITNSMHISSNVNTKYSTTNSNSNLKKNYSKIDILSLVIKYIAICIELEGKQSPVVPKQSALNVWLEKQENPSISKQQVREARRALKEDFDILLYINSNKLSNTSSTLISVYNDLRQRRKKLLTKYEMKNVEYHGRSQTLYSSLAVNSHPSLLQMRKSGKQAIVGESVGGKIKVKTGVLRMNAGNSTQMQSNVNTFTIEPFVNHSLSVADVVVDKKKKSGRLIDTVQSDTSSNQPIL